MKKITINGKIYNAEDNSSLKILLKSVGFVFPCGGEGRCGRCKVICNEIKATALDSKFLNEKQLVAGVRLACDKLIESDYVIQADAEHFGASENIKKLHECRIAVSIGSRNVILSILDTDIVEIVTLPNPLYQYGSFSSLSKKYSADRAIFSKLLRNCIGKESVELFEKYGTAKADTLAIAGNEFYIKILMGLPLNQEILDYNELVENDNLSLPTEQIYILPSVNQYIGGEVLCEMVDLPENSLLIDCEDICTFAYIGEEENTLAAMWDFTYSDLELHGIKAGVKTFINNLKIAPMVYLYGQNSVAVGSIIEELGLTHIEKEKKIDNVAKACLLSRFRAKLNKEKIRSRYFSLVNSEEFHDFFAENSINN